MPASLGCDKIENEKERERCKQQELSLNKAAAEAKAAKAAKAEKAGKSATELRTSHADITDIAAGTLKSPIVIEAQRRFNSGESGIVNSWGLGKKGGSKKRNRKIQSKKKSRRTRRAKR